MNGFNVAILVCAFLIIAAGLFAVIVERTNERDEARDAFEHEAAANVQLNAENARLEQDNMRMAVALAEAVMEAELLAGKNPRALRLVPLPPMRAIPGGPRDGSEYEWPAAARQIRHDDLTALMRAVEED